MALKPGTDMNMEHDAQLAADYRRAAEEMPPAALDERIRAAARREVGAGPRRASRRPAWQVPLSLAAVVLLSVTVVLMMRDGGVDRVEPEWLPPPVGVVAPQRAAEPAADRRAVETPRPAAAPPAAPSATGVQQVNPAPAETAPSALAKALPLTDSPPPDAARLSGDASAERNAAPVREAARPMLRSAPAGVAADAAAGPSLRAPAALSAPVPERPLWHDLLNEPAEKWAQRIVEWRRAGRSADADLLVAEFRRRFPDQTLPDAAAGR